MNQVCSFLSILFLISLSACASSPKASHEKISQKEGESFLAKYCSHQQSSSFENELIGEVVIRSSTKEFKGQYPASIHFAKNKNFSVEVTNLVGGTVFLLKGDRSSAEIISPSRPQYNRKGITHYMGLPIPVLLQLLHGDLPCVDTLHVRTEGSSVVIEDLSEKNSPLEWWYERSGVESDSVPVRLRIMDHAQVKVEMTIEKWNSSDFYAEKVKVHTVEGDLKWTWRSREIK